MSEIVVEGGDYRFTTDAWSRYTGRQIIVGSFIVLGAALLAAGWSWGFTAFDKVIIETADVILIVEGEAPPGVLLGPGLSAIGVSVISLSLPGWPHPSRYGEPIEEVDNGD